MNEKIIVKGKSSKLNILTISFGLVAIILWGVAWIAFLQGNMNILWFSRAEVFTAATIAFFLILSCCKIVVTDKRIYGKIIFGRQVDLPLDSITAVTVTSFLTQGVSVATSSGRITFFYLGNRKEIADKIRELLIQRQIDTPTTTITQERQPSNAEELKTYKELLDGGALTQEEFEVKKRQLLNL